MQLTKSPLAIASGLLLGLATVQAGEVIINQFDSEDEISAWSWETWSNEALISFDSTLDAGGGGGTGSMRVVNNFPNNPGGYSQAVISMPMGTDVDAETLYKSLEFDIKLDPASSTRVDGVNYGYIEAIFRNGPDWTWNGIGGMELTAANFNWTHMSIPVKAPGDKVHHLTIKLGENNLTNTVIYNIDNIKWIESDVQLPPPTMAIEKTKPGLNLLAGTPGQYDRQNVKTTTPGFGWIGSSDPVTFSVTIKDFPSGATYGGMQSHIYLAPGTPGGGEAPDWTEPTCILIAIQENADATASMTFRYKTNAPNSNGPSPGGYFNEDPAGGFVGTLGSVAGASVRGTWSVTFANDTQITLKAPDGTTKTVTMPAEDAAQFAGDITAYFGTMPGQNVNIGQAVILGGISIKTGNTVVISDNFTAGPLDDTKWTVSAASKSCVSLITASEPYWVSWTTPSSGFTLQTSATAKPDSWVDSTLTDTLLGTRKRVLIPSSELPGASMGFFRLIKVQ